MKNKFLTPFLLLLGCMGLVGISRGEVIGRFNCDSLAEFQAVKGTKIMQVETAPGKNGECLYFPEEASFIQIPTKKLINPVQGTLQMWVKNEGFENVYMKEIRMMFYVYYGKGNIFCSEIAYGNSQPDITTLAREIIEEGKYNDRKMYFYPRKEGWSLDEWHFLAWTWGAEKIRFYVDGVLAESTEVHDLLQKKASEGSTYLGGTGTGQNGFKNGYIDDIIAHNVERSESDVLNDFKFGYGDVKEVSK